MTVDGIRHRVHPIDGLNRGKRRSQSWWVWAFMAPTVILLGLFVLYPIGASYFYSLTEWSGFGSTPIFVGIRNFQQLFADPLFWNSVAVTLIFMVLAVPLQVGLSFLFAMLLNSPRMPLRGLFRTAIFLPVVTTAAVVGIIMEFILDPSNGPAITFLSSLGLIKPGTELLSSSSTALWTTVIVYVWKWCGIAMIYWLAALQTVPEELYEAAKLDGAGSLSIMRFITLPLLKPFLLIITALMIEASLKVFDLVLTLTSGGPYHATEVLEIYIYRWAFELGTPQLGYASAAGVLFGGFVLIIGGLQLAAFAFVRRGSRT